MKNNFDFGKYSFINYTDLNSDQSNTILEERNNKSVRKWMSTPDIISTQEHKDFLINLKKANNRLYWLVLRNNLPVGSVNIVDITQDNSSGVWGYFLFDKYQGTGWGIDIQFFALSIFFNYLALDCVFGCINKDNKNSLAIQPIFNFSYFSETIEQYTFILTKDKYLLLSSDLKTFKMEKLLKNGKLITNN